MKSGAVLKEEPPRYTFTNDWFHQSAVIDVWEQVLGTIKPDRILEVGCYEGRATTFMIERCSPVSVTCVDTWDGGVDLSPELMKDVELRFDENIAEARRHFNATVHKIKSPSFGALPRLLAEGKRFDLIYIDGSHTAPNVLSDAVDCFRLCREGGALIFDDYVWCMEPHGSEDSLNMPKPAIDAFVNIYARKLQIMHVHGQMMLMKTHD